MKILLVLTLSVLVVAEEFARSTEKDCSASPSTKEILRKQLNSYLELVKPGEFGSICPRLVSTKEQEFGHQKLGEFIQCASATIDLFINRLNDTVDLVDFKNIKTTAQLYAEPICEIFDNLFKCIRDFEPVIDLCLDERAKVFKNKLFAIAPLIHQTICLRNGALAADIVGHDDGIKCWEHTNDSLYGIGSLELFNSNSSELFGDSKVCQNFNDILQKIYVEVGKCSKDVLEMIKEMLGFFCDGTKCEHYIHDLQCY